LKGARASPPGQADQPLALIKEAGFADQSLLTALFRRETG
jgi:AraC-like DNA-binding protein